MTTDTTGSSLTTGKAGTSAKGVSDSNTNKAINRLLWTVVNTCRLAVSAAFIFSGVVKLIDPIGVQYRIEDYLAAFGLPASTGSVIPLLLAVGLSLIEFLLGIYLFFGIRRRLTSWTLLFFMLFYTPLTLWLALTNKVADCGCFGDAVHLTNWQTFSKNVVLLAATLVIWWRGQLMRRFISESAQWIISLYSILFGLLITIQSLVREPIVDFRPYHIGQHIPSAMEWPEDPADVPEILDFSFFPVNDAIASPASDASDAIPTDAETLLSDTSYTFLLISPHLELADDGAMDRINATYDYACRHGYPFLALTASGEEAIHRWEDLTGAEYPFAFMDELTLKTIARTNPAIVLLHDGTIVGKWPAARMPAAELRETPLHALPLAHPQPESHRRSTINLLLWYLLPLLALTLTDRFIFSLRRGHRNTPKQQNAID